MSATRLADEEIFKVSDGLKGQNKVGNFKFWAKYSIFIFKFFPFLYTMKACRWNLINFSKLKNTLIWKEKKHWHSSQSENKKLDKLDFVLWQVVL